MYSAGSQTVVLTGFMLNLRNVFSEFFRFFNVPALRGFIAAAEQENNFPASLGEINPVTGTKINNKFGNIISDRFGVSKIAAGNTADTGIDNITGFSVRQGAYPGMEGFSFPYIRLCFIVSQRIQAVKRLF